MRKVFSILAAVTLFATGVQFFLAASGAFDSAPTEEAFKPHRGLGYLILLLAVVLVVIAAVAKLPGRLTGLSGAVAGLVLLQPLIAVLAKAFGDQPHDSVAARLVFGLHGVNGVIIMVLLRNIMRQSRTLTADGAPVESPARSIS